MGSAPDQQTFCEGHGLEVSSLFSLVGSERGPEMVARCQRSGNSQTLTTSLVPKAPSDGREYSLELMVLEMPSGSPPSGSMLTSLEHTLTPSTSPPKKTERGSEPRLSF